MALSEIERRRCEKALAQFLERRRPPENLRDQLDIGYRMEGQSVEIFETRPDWQDNSKKMETPAAKATFVRTTNRWRVFWMRRDLKWHGYEPMQSASPYRAITPPRREADRIHQHQQHQHRHAGEAGAGYFIGVGGKLEDLETFRAREFALALLA